MQRRILLATAAAGLALPAIRPATGQGLFDIKVSYQPSLYWAVPFFIAGENDSETTHADKFREQMKALNIPEGLLLIPGAPHAFPGRQKWFDQMLEASAAWFDKHLK